MDTPDKNSCIKCDKGGNLLVCSEYSCPIALHAGCLGCPARFDDAKRFYCPYCLYKQAVAESHKAREHALATKKALMIFMEGKVIGSEKHIEHKTCDDNRHSQSKTSPVNFTSHGNGKSISNNNGIRDQTFHLEEDSEASVRSKGQDPLVEMHGKKSKRTEEGKQVQEKERKTSAEEQVQETERETSTEEEQVQETERETSEEEEKTQEEEHETSVEEEKIQEEEHEISVEEEKTREEERETSVEEENIQEEESEMSSASADQEPLINLHARTKRGSKRSRPVDDDSDVDPMHSKLLQHDKKKKKTSPLTVTPTRRSSRKSSLAVGSGKLVNEKVGSPRRLKKPEEPLAKRASNMFGSPKRKRLLWTKEEEDAIRAGVAKYLKEGNTNIPWKKILDSPLYKFDATRTPCDLKDKWRNMSGR